MITTFVCEIVECPNNGIEYNFEEVIGQVECGGCKAILEPKPTA